MMEDIAQSFVRYFNNNFDRNFSLIDWIDYQIIDYDEIIFTNYQLTDIYESCLEIIKENVSEEDSYYIIVDMNEYECIGTTSTPNTSEKNHEYIFIDPSSYYRYYDYPDDVCKEAIENHFNISFEIEKIYDFDVTTYLTL